jgi:tight adherence protein B
VTGVLVACGVATVVTPAFVLADRVRRRRRLARVLPPLARRGRGWLCHPWRTAGLAATAGAVVGLVLGGPVAGLLVAAYGVAGIRWWVSRRRSVVRSHAEHRACDAVSSLAADLRTGLPPEVALASVRPLLAGAGDPVAAPAVRPVEERIAAAFALAGTVGIPVADLLDRVDADLRSLSRARAHAAAEAAGAQATAVLLAALPAVGILLGYGVGADPVEVLLHTRVGAGCAVAAVLLQTLGSAWSVRLIGAIGGPR